MNALVTGGAGFIGSHLTDYLLAQGAEVIVIDNLSTGNISNLNSDANFIEADLNTHNLDHLLNKIDFVFHTAALPRILPSFEERFDHHQANIDVTLKLLEASHRQNVKKIIYSGTSAVYGQPSITPTPESSLIAPLNPYALQKYTSEQYGLILGRHLSLPFISLRYFNPYGPRSYNPENQYSAYSSVIGIFQDRVINNKPLLITGDGSQTRDFIHVEDLAKANVCAAMSDVDFGCFNIGFGKTKSVIEIAKLLSSDISFVKKRLGEASITLADIGLAKSLLDWSPEIEVDNYLSTWLSNFNMPK
jgi:UDP-glucose 4-epimerase